jgi:signal transduction histidine kinase
MRFREITSGRYLLKVAIVFLGYLIAGRLGLQVPFTDLNVSPVWPAAGVALAAIVIWGYAIWPGIALGAFFVNFLSPIPHAAALGITVGNTASPMLGGLLLNRTRGFDRSLRRLRDVILLVVFGSVVATTVAATGGTTTLYLSGLRPWSAYSASWLMWWAGDGIGVLLFTPLILGTREAWQRRIRPRHVGEGLALVIGALVICAFVFGGHVFPSTTAHILAFGLFPFVIWAAIRFGTLGTSVVSSGLALITVWETANGRGPFVESAPLFNAALLQVFLALISLTGMILAAVVLERETAEERLARERQLIQERDHAEAERRLAEAALLRNEKLAAAGSLAAAIAHEINNPLAAITNIAHLLKTASVSSDVGQLLDLLATEVGRISYVAKHTLSFYREAGPPVSVELRDVIEEVLRVYAPRFREISVERRYLTSGEVEAYPVEMHQVFSNLLLNAAEATGKGGQIAIEICDAPDDFLRLAVRDNGPGIPASVREKLFQAFFSTKPESGTGLGLWITHNIVQKHGGRIEVTSSAEGETRGTEFTVLLPKRWHRR